MSISFSGMSYTGMAAGVDTSAWIESLVSMKQAAIDAYNEKKEALVLTTGVLENVKTFFTSFKNVISNVTNSNLGIASFDLFAQNLVESSNAAAVSALVTTEAKEANYEVNVNQVATETEAVSTYYTDITTTTTAIASLNSLLSSIGIGTGQIGITVDGVERFLTLQSNDTIGSLIDKFNKLGVYASYDPIQGYFSVNLDVDQINDDPDGDGINNTGIKDALFLQNVNSGYASDLLELFASLTNVITATESCKMSLFGVTNGEYIISDSLTGEFTVHNFDINKTFREFFDEIAQYGLEASLTEEGEVTINVNGGYLISGALAEDLGLVTADNSYQTTTKASSTIGTFSNETIQVDYTSSLGEIGAIKANTDTLQILDINNNLLATITTLTQDSSVDDLITTLARYGITANLDNNVITLESANGNIIGGTIAENMGIETYQSSITTIKSGNSTTSTTMVSYVASATDWISDCLWDVWDSYSAADKVITVSHTDRYGTDKVYTYTVVAKNSIGSDGSVLKGTQFQDIANWYKQLDPTATFEFNDNGQIFIDSNDCFYFEGTIAEYLGLSTYKTSYTWTEGITTTSSSNTISFRIRKTDHLSDVLWDNGWASYSAADRVISAYSLTVDHTTANNSQSHPDGAEGNYVENAGTYQHTVQTLVKTFTVIESQTSIRADGSTTTIVQGTTFEDLARWFTTEVDTTATFLINNDGTITIDSDNTFHLEGRVITDLGLDITTITQSWTTGTAATQSTASVTFAAKMTDYISDTYTSSQWANVNKTISVYNTSIDHDNNDGTSQRTVQSKLTDIVIDNQMTFNSLANTLSEYGITLTMDNGIIRVDSSTTNFIVEECFYNQAVNNVNAPAGTTSMLSHFGITYDTVSMSWTTGTAATESTAIIKYNVKMTDYVSDTFTDSEWNALNSYTDSSGNVHTNGKEIAIMHSYIDHANQRTIIENTTNIVITTETTFNQLSDFLATLSSDDRYNINLSINDGVLTLDSNCCWIEGSIANHYGIRTDSVTMNWTTGTAATESTDIVDYYITYSDYVSDTFTKSDWNSLSTDATKYTDTANHTHAGNELAIMHSYIDHANQRTIIETKTVITMDTSMTFDSLKNILAHLDDSDSRNNIALTIDNGILRLDSNCCWIECSNLVKNHWGIKNDSVTMNWTTGTAATESTGRIDFNVSYGDYIRDPFPKQRWDTLADYTDSAGNTHNGKQIAVMHTYVDHASQRTIIETKTVINITTETKFSDLQYTLAHLDSSDPRNNIDLTIDNGIVKLDSDCCWIEGRIPDFFGITKDDIVQNWTTGTASTESTATVSYAISLQDYLADTFKKSDWDALNSKTYTDSAGNTHNGKQIAVMHTYVDHASQKTIIETKTVIDIDDNMTFGSRLSMNTNNLQYILAHLDDSDSRNNIALNIVDGVVTLDSNCCWIEGLIPDHYGIRTDSVTMSWTTGTIATESTDTVSYKVCMTDYVSDCFSWDVDIPSKGLFAWQNLSDFTDTAGNSHSGHDIAIMYNDVNHATQQTVVHTKTVIAIDTNTTFNSLADELAKYGITLSISNGIISLRSKVASDGNLYYWEGTIPKHFSNNATGTYSTISQSWTVDTVGTTSTDGVTFKSSWTDYISDSYSSTAWASEDKNILVHHNYLDHSTQTVKDVVIGTITVDNTMTLGDQAHSLRSVLASYTISLGITNGTLTIDSDCLYLTGDIANHFGIGLANVNTIVQTWTTGLETTIGTPDKHDIHMEDRISDCYTTSVWNSKDKVIYLYEDHLNHESLTTAGDEHVVKTPKGSITVGTDWTFQTLADTLKNYGLTLGISGSAVTISSNRQYYIEGVLCNDFGITTTTVTQTWTQSISETTGSVVSYSADMNNYVSSTYLNWDSGNDAWMSANHVLTIKHNYIDHANQTVKTDDIGTITVGDYMTFAELSAALGNYGISFSISNGVITIDSDCNYVVGDIATKLGISTTPITQTWTTGLRPTSGTTPEPNIGAPDMPGDDFYEWGPQLVGKTFEIKDQTYNFSSKSVETSTVATTVVTSSTTLQEFKEWLAGYDLTFNVSGATPSISSSTVAGRYVTGDGATALGLTTHSETMVHTYGVDKTGTFDTYRVNNDTTIHEVLYNSWGSLNKTITVKQEYVSFSADSTTYSVKTRELGSTVIDESTTFGQLASFLSGKNISLSISNGTISLSGSNNSYVEGATLQSLGLTGTSDSSPTFNIGATGLTTGTLTTSNAGNGTAYVSDIVGWANLSDKNIYVLEQYYDYSSGSAKARTVATIDTTGKTVGDLDSSLASYRGTSTNGWGYVLSGAAASLLYNAQGSTTANVIYLNPQITGRKLTATAQGDSKMTDFGFSSTDGLSVGRYNAMTGFAAAGTDATINVGSKTFDEFVAEVKAATGNKIVFGFSDGAFYAEIVDGWWFTGGSDKFSGLTGLNNYTGTVIVDSSTWETGTIKYNYSYQTTTVTTTYTTTTEEVQKGADELEQIVLGMAVGDIIGSPTGNNTSGWQQLVFENTELQKSESFAFCGCDPAQGFFKEVMDVLQCPSGGLGFDFEVIGGDTYCTIEIIGGNGYTPLGGSSSGWLDVYTGCSGYTVWNDCGDIWKNSWYYSAPNNNGGEGMYTLNFNMGKQTKEVEKTNTIRTTTTITATETRNLDDWAWENVKLGDLASGMGYNDWYDAVRWVDDGKGGLTREKVQLSQASTKTLKQMAEEFAQYGITISRNGSKAKATSSGGGNGSYVFNGGGVYFTKKSENTTSKTLFLSDTKSTGKFTKTADSSTKLKELGLSSGGTIKYNSIGNNYNKNSASDSSLSFNGSTTLSSLLRSINGLTGVSASLSNGAITITQTDGVGNNFITSMFSGIGLPTDGTDYYSSKSVNIKSAGFTRKANTYYANADNSACTASLFGGAKNVTIALHTDGITPSTVTTTVITWGSSDSLGSFISKLNSVTGITASWDSTNHKINLSGSAYAYVQSSDISFGTTTANGSVTMKRASASNTPSVTVTPVTTASDIGGEKSLTVNFIKDNQYTKDFTTANGITVSNTSGSKTFTWGSNQTLQQFIDSINNSTEASVYGFSASCDSNGHITVKGSDKSYFTPTNIYGASLDPTYNTKSYTIITEAAGGSKVTPKLNSHNKPNDVGGTSTFTIVHHNNSTYAQDNTKATGCTSTSTVTWAEGDTLSQFIAKLAEKNITATIDDNTGIFTFTGTEYDYVSNISGVLASCLTLNNPSYTYTLQQKASQSRDITVYLDLTTLPYQPDLSLKDNSITIVHHLDPDFVTTNWAEHTNLTSTVPVKWTGSLHQFINDLAAEGITMTYVANGRYVKIKGDENTYIENISDDLASTLGLNNYKAELSPYTLHLNNVATPVKIEEPLSVRSKLKYYGITSTYMDVVTHTNNTYVADNTKATNCTQTVRITWTGESTFADVIADLSAAGITATIDAQAKTFAFTGDENHYVNTVESKFADILNISTKENSTYGKSYSYTLNYRANADDKAEYVYLNERNTKLFNLGLSAQTMEIVLHRHNTFAQNCTDGEIQITNVTKTLTVTWSETESLGDFQKRVNTLLSQETDYDGNCRYGITFSVDANTGKWSFQGNEYTYINKIGDLAGKMKISPTDGTAYGSHYNYTINYRAISDNNDDYCYLNERNTKLFNLSITTPQTMDIVLHTNNTFAVNNTDPVRGNSVSKISNVTRTITVTWTTDQTLAQFEQSVKNTLAAQRDQDGICHYDMNFTVDINSKKWKFIGNEYTYVNRIDAPLENAMKLTGDKKESNTYGKSYQYTINYRADADDIVDITPIHKRTLLGDIGIDTPQTVSIYLHTHNTFCETQTEPLKSRIGETGRVVTVTWGTSQTLEEFQLAIQSVLASSTDRDGNCPYAMTFNIDETNGKWKFTGNEYTYVQSISSQLENRLNLTSDKKENGTYGRSYQYTINYRADADNIVDKTLLNERNTRLSNLTISTPQTMDIVLHTNNTFAVNNTDPARGNSTSKIENVTRTITVTWTMEQTLGEFEQSVKNTLAAQGDQDGICHYDMTFSVDPENGKWKFTGNEYTYVNRIDAPLENYMKLTGDKKEDGTYGRSYQYTINYRADADDTIDKTFVNERNTKLFNMTITEAQTMDIVLHTNNTFAVNNTDPVRGNSKSKIENVTRTITVTWTTDQTLGEFEQSVKNTLAAQGDQDGICHYDMTFSVDPENGKWKFTGNEYTYVNRIDAPLENYMKLTGDKKEYGTYGRSYQYTINYRADADDNFESTYLNERNAKLRNMSINTDQTISIVVHTNNTYSQDNTKATGVTDTITVTWSAGSNLASGETLEQFENKVNTALYNLWIAEGRPNNISDTTNNAMSDLIEKIGDLYYHDQEYIKNTLLTFDSVQNNSTLKTWVERIGNDSYNQATVKASVKAAATTAANDGRYYIKFEVDPENGKLKFAGDENTYINDISDALENFVKLTGDSKEGGTYGQSYYYTTNFRSDADNAIDYTYLNERNTALQNLSYIENGRTVSITQSQSIEIVLHINNTYAQDTTKSDIQQKNISSTNTVYTTTTVGMTVTSTSPVGYDYNSWQGSAVHFVMNNGSTITLNNGESMIQKFESAGLIVNTYNGRMTITGDADHYITSMDSALKNALHIQVGEGYTYEKIVTSSIVPGQTHVNEVITTGITQTSSSDAYCEIETTANASTTFAKMGINTDGLTYVYGADGNIKGSFSVNSSTTLSQFISAINSKNPSAGATLSNGVISIGSGYITGSVAVALGVDQRSSSGSLRITNSNKISTSTTLKELGMDSAAFEINGNTVVNISSGDNVVNKLRSAGLTVSVNNGKISITGDANHYITDMSEGLADALKISIGNNSTYRRTIVDSGARENAGAVTRTVTVTWTYGALGTSDNDLKPETLEEFINDINATLQVQTTQYKEMFDLKDDFRVSAYVDGDGVFHFIGNEYTYVRGFGDAGDSRDVTTYTSQLEKALKLTGAKRSNGTYGDAYGYELEYKNDTHKIDNQTQYSYVNYDNMTLRNFDLNQSQYITIVTNNNTTFSADTTKNHSVLYDTTSSTYVIEWTIGNTGQTKNNNGTYNNSDNGIRDGETFGEFIYELEHFGSMHSLQTEASAALGNGIYGIHVTINPDNTISLVGNEYTYILGISDDLQKIFKIDHYHTEDQVLTAENGISLTTSTKLSALGLSGGSFTMNNGTVVNIGANDSIVSKLRGAGLSVSINNGKIVIDGNSSKYVKSVSKDLADALNFKIGSGYYYSTYDYDLYFTGADKNANYNSKYYDYNHDIEFTNNNLTDQVNTTLLNYDTRLNNLSILANMTMTLETPEGGKSIEIDPDETIQQLKERLFSDYGIDVTIGDKDGLLTFTPTRANEGYYIVGIDSEFKEKFHIITGENGTYTIDSEYITPTGTPGVYTTAHRTVTAEHGTYGTSTLNNYDNTASRNLEYTDDHITTKLSTRLSKLNGYESGNGKILVHYADGLEQEINLKSSMTIGQLCEVLGDYGVKAEILAGGRVTFSSNDGTYLKSMEGGSNLLEVLNMSDFDITTEGTTVITSKTLHNTVVSTSTYFATETTMLSHYAEGLLEANGVITFSLNDKIKSVTITSDDTFGTLAAKFNDKGLKSKIEAGVFSVSSGFDTFSIIESATTSNLAAIIKFNEKQDLGGYSMTDRSKTIISTTTITQTNSLSIANYADQNTKFETFNIMTNSSGTLSVYKDGKKATVTISGLSTAKSLQDELRAAFGQNIDGSEEENINVAYIDGCLKIYQNNANIIVGSNEDTSNFAAITGIMSDKDGAAYSTRKFYKVNNNSKVMETGLFRNGDVTEGSFVVGNATVTIDKTTTIGEIISQINTNPESNATAYWDSINGEFVIKSKSTGDFYINIEAKSSNFTDVLGLTSSEFDEENNTVTSSNIKTDAQRNGKNAKVTINGANYVSSSNIISSDITGIKGLTINVKELTTDAPAVLSVKKDVESLALAINDVVDAYNALIENINSALNSKTAKLRGDSDLRQIRNRIKSIMTGTNKNSSIFKNAVAIGIVTDVADPANISVGNGIYKLTLDVEKFAKAFEADADGVRTLLIGKVDEFGNLIEEGILTQLESLIDEALESSSGYFEKTEMDYEKQIDKIETKIVKGNLALEKYRERLEKKYMSMNILNGNMQTQYKVYFS